MNRHKRWPRWSLWILVCVGGAGACGTPEIQGTRHLQVVYLPLEGAIQVDKEVYPGIWFSDHLDPGSIDEESVRLEMASLVEGTTGHFACDSSWTAVEGSAQPDANNDHKLVYVPDEVLLTTTCFRMLVTTRVQGLEQGSLRDLYLPDLERVGAIQSFLTAEE